MPYAVLNFDKCKSSQIGSIDHHNNRRHTPPNVDPSRLHLNEALVGEGRPIQDLVKNHLDKNYSATTTRKTKEGIKQVPLKIRKDATVAVNIVLSASPEYFRPDNPAKVGEYDQEQLEPWISANLKYLKKEYGENLVSATLHLDEDTPHIHATVVPLKEGRLVGKKMFFNGAKHMASHHDKYHEYIGELGIFRGEKASISKNEIKRNKGELASLAEQIEQAQSEGEIVLHLNESIKKRGEKLTEENKILIAKSEHFERLNKYYKEELIKNRTKNTSLFIKNKKLHTELNQAKKDLELTQQSEIKSRKVIHNVQTAVEKQIIANAIITLEHEGKFEQDTVNTAQKTFKMRSEGKKIGYIYLFGDGKFFKACQKMFRDVLKLVTSTSRGKPQDKNAFKGSKRSFTPIEDLVDQNPIKSSQRGIGY